MGLFDAAANDEGSTADLAARLGLPILLVVDAARQSQSVAALVHGFRSFRPDVAIGGVILNRVASPRHETLLRRALAPLRSEEHTSELQSLMRISYAVFCLKKKNKKPYNYTLLC